MCRYLTETLELLRRTQAAHVPDTGHLHQAFPSSFPVLFARASVVVVIPSLCIANYQQAISQSYSKF